MTLLLEYWVGEGGTHVFVGRAELAEPAVVRLEIGRAELTEAAGWLLGERPRPEALQDRLGALVAPAADWAEPGELVWLVPHDLLHQIPLHALSLPDGQVLAERHPVCYTPSASIMTYVRGRAPRVPRRAVVFADSRSGDAPLLHAEAQGLALRETLGGEAVEVHSGGAVTREAVLAGLAGEADVLHVACHGVFDPQAALRSGFALAGADVALFTAEDFTARRCRPDLVVLSACESGVNLRGPGDELIGLTRAILYSGAASVVVSLWSVDEISTSLLMRGFYAELVGGAGKAVALQRAQRATREMTIGQVVAYCEALRPERAGAARRMLDLDIADLAFRAGDFAVALAGYERLAAEPEVAGPERVALVAAAARSRRALRAGATPDYSRRPFADAYYWAPFVLVGDWR
ncbi:CHAT domain-containing protein [Actinoallomurus sp. NPDC050550]|uniref:CHAT domain-containing protein n=1 Tax=Actinoallomurus sp. NPDC050550 TaxID=3154937 RepID=UPI0033C57BBA